jgi:hypothetical protein
MRGRGRLRAGMLALMVALPIAFVALPAGVSQAACNGVSTWTDLSNAFLSSQTVTLCQDITAGSDQSLTVGDGTISDTTSVTLDLNGHKLSIPNPNADAAAIYVPSGASLTVQDSNDPGDTGLLTVTGGQFSAGIGGDIDRSESSGSVTIDGATVDAAGGDGAAGIGGASGGTGTGGAGGSITIESGSTVTATAGSQAAAIGGGFANGTGGAGGTIIINGATVSTTGGVIATGIGGGAGGTVGGAGGTITIEPGSQVTTTCGQQCTGIGGGDGEVVGGAGGDVTITGGTVNAIGGIAAEGIGGGYGGYGGIGGAGAALTIDSGANVTAAGGAGATAIGGGDGGSTGVFGSLSNGGTLTLPSGSVENVPSGTTADNSGTIELDASLTGDGTVDNTGTILVESDGSVADNGNPGGDTGLTVSTNNYALSFSNNGGGSGSPAPATIYVYAPTVTASEQSLPGGPTPPAGSPNNTGFVGWYTATVGGTQITATTPLATALDASGPPVAATLDAQFGCSGVSNFDDLQTAFATGGTMALCADISTDDGALTVGSGLPGDTTATTLDLNGFSLNINTNASAVPAIDVPAGASLTVLDSNDPGQNGTLTVVGGPDAPGIGDGGTVTIDSGTDLTPSGGAGASPIGAGGPGGSGAFGSLSNDGTLTLLSGSTETVPAGTTVENSGTIDLFGSLTGDGTIDNTGTIFVESGGSVADNGNPGAGSGLTVSTHNYALSFNDNGGSGTTPSTLYVYSDTAGDDDQSIPAGPAPPATGTFKGWYTTPTGGTQITTSTPLATALGASGPPVAATLDAQYLVPAAIGTNPQSQSVPAEADATFTAAATGDPAPTIQWQSCAPGDICSPLSKEWANVTDATSTTLTLDDLQASQSGTEYRAVFTNTSGSVDTAPATLTVTGLEQTITFAPVPATASASAGASDALSATGGASGEPVEFSVDSSTSPADACSVTQTASGVGTVSFAHAGTCVIDANQAAGGNYAEALTVSQTVTISSLGADVSVSNPPAIVLGQGASVTATVTEQDGSAPSGSIQFSVDGAPVGSPVAVGSGGAAVSPNLNGSGTLAPGGHTLTAAFTATDPQEQAPGSGTATLSVSAAASSTTVSVTPGAVSAAVAAVAPGAGTPTGSVTFSADGVTIGTASLSSGTATLNYTVPVGKVHSVAASYAGSTDFTGSSGSTSVSNPSIVARLSSATKKTRYGWYRSPVTVTFTCTTNGAPLTTPCPAAVTLSASRAGQSVSRTITSTNGGTATVAVSKINIDRVRPTVQIVGVKAGTVYSILPGTVRCSARAGLSGLASCRVQRHQTTSGGGLETTTVRYTATATDKAGNTNRATVTVHELAFSLEGVPYVNGAFQVTAGRTYTIIVHSSSRPRYIDASPDPGAPAGNDLYFFKTGPDQWTLGVTLSDGLFANSSRWALGVEINGVVHDIPVQST